MAVVPHKCSQEGMGRHASKCYSTTQEQLGWERLLPRTRECICYPVLCCLCYPKLTFIMSLSPTADEMCLALLFERQLLAMRDLVIEAACDLSEASKEGPVQPSSAFQRASLSCSISSLKNKMGTEVQGGRDCRAQGSKGCRGLVATRAEIQ